MLGHAETVMTGVRGEALLYEAQLHDQVHVISRRCEG